MKNQVKELSPADQSSVPTQADLAPELYDMLESAALYLAGIPKDKFNVSSELRNDINEALKKARGE